MSGSSSAPYSPNLVEGVFPEVRIHGPAYRPVRAPGFSQSAALVRPRRMHLATRLDGYSSPWMAEGSQWRRPTLGKPAAPA
jgi:hypothetical protein